MVFRYSYLVPIVVLFWFPITFLITYLISLFGNKIQPIFPFISDTGTWSPESCIFGLLLNTGAILIGVIVYIRYRQVRELFENENDFKPSIKTINRNSAIFGILAVFGMMVVGNFQETNQIIVHVIGASMAFGFGTVFACTQTYISFAIYPKLGSRKLNIFRVVLCIIGCTTCITTSLFAILGLLNYKGDVKNLPKWTKGDGGFTYRTGSAISEWILVISTVIYLSTFTYEFRQVAFSEPPIKLNDV